MSRRTVRRRALAAIAYTSSSIAVLLLAACGTTQSVNAMPPVSRSALATTPLYPNTSSSSTTPTVAPTATSGDCNCGILEQFTPVSASTWWAIVESNLKPETYLVRTTDSGAHWRNVLTTHAGMNGYFPNANVAWITEGTQIYRTFDGGTSWQRMGLVPSDFCQFDFVDTDHGWCSAIAPAMGSSGVTLYLTSDGGITWVLVSETSIPGTGPSSPASLPYGCDKTITFTSTKVGWAYSICDGGDAYLYETDDSGYKWFKLPLPPIPPGAQTGGGEDFGEPAVDGPTIAVRFDVGGDTAIANSSNGGATWHTQLIGRLPQQWSVDLINPSDWILTDGNILKATEDAGLHWRTWKPSVGMKDSIGNLFTLDFNSSVLGWVTPDANPGPIWWTRDGGTNWKPVVIDAGPYKVD